MTKLVFFFISGQRWGDFVTGGWNKYYNRITFGGIRLFGRIL